MRVRNKGSILYDIYEYQGEQEGEKYSYKCLECGTLLMEKLHYFRNNTKCVCQTLKRRPRAEEVKRQTAIKMIEERKNKLLNRFKNETIYKKEIEFDLYSLIKKNNIFGDSIILSGPDLTRHVEAAKNTFSRAKDIINIVEIDKLIYGSISDEYESLRDPYIYIHHRDVMNMPSYNIEDIDLTGGLLTSGHIIKERLKKQKDLLGPKALIFTICLRTALKENIYESIELLMKEELEIDLILRYDRLIKSDSFDQKKSRFIRSVDHVILGEAKRYKDFKLYFYCDKSPMFTGIIIYE